MKAQKLFYCTKIFFHLNAVGNHKRSNQTVVKEKHAFIFHALWWKWKEERNCSKF
jgi:hypothetical protein